MVNEVCLISLQSYIIDKMISERIHNLIFDLGGVIYQIDFDRQKKAFSEVGIGDFEKLYAQALQDPLFCDLETGKIQNEIFRENLMILTGKEFSESTIDALWNSILIDFYHDNVRLLQKLKFKYRIYMLSNTNAIHYNFYSAQFLKSYGYNLDDLFYKCYWSFKIGMRKPNQEIFMKVINENGLTHENALFIDDTFLNTASAEKVGLTSYWLQPGEDLHTLFDENLLITLSQ